MKTAHFSVRLRSFPLCLFVAGLFLASAAGQDYEGLKERAEQLYAEGSYAQAHALYEQAKTLSLSLAEARWVDFRLADTLWRSEAASKTFDSTRVDQAREQLETLVRDIQRVEDQDRVWAEAQESLGDFWWTRRDQRNWGAAWPFYQRALDWWAGSSDLELARGRYLGLVKKMAEPPGAEPHYYYTCHGNVVPMEILDNALRIAQDDNDKAFLHYLAAMTLRYAGGDGRERAGEEFEAAIRLGRKTNWYDDALYHYGVWLMGGNIIVFTEDGQLQRKADYVKAVEMFRRIVKEFSKGETRYYDSARQQIENLTGPQVRVAVRYTFLPESEVAWFCETRNVKRVDFSIFRVDLTRNIACRDPEKGWRWIEEVDRSGCERVKSFSWKTGDTGRHEPVSKDVRLDGKLPPGAYLLEASAEGKTARDIILVTEAALVLKASAREALAYVCRSGDGAPLAKARVRLWQRWHDGQKWRWADAVAETDQDGLARFNLEAGARQVQMFAACVAGDWQAYAENSCYVWWNRARGEADWRIYAFTDRPAYRPGERVEWKIVARTRDGEGYATPGGETLRYEITDPRGTKVREGRVALNAFGSAWDGLEVTESMPLGSYHIHFWHDRGDRRIGAAELFRLEEYKLPEFKVGVRTPEENGRKRAFLLGETVEAEIQADYYFGGPVANATAEVVVRQKPFRHWWCEPRAFGWFYTDRVPRPYWGEGQIVKRETLRTDANGKARIFFDTPRHSAQDFEYEIEARVTDASRREIVGKGRVRVTRQRYYVYLNPEHYLVRPQDKVTVKVKTLDANDQPVVAEGRVKVTRDRWVEIWVRPDGREVTGKELDDLRRKHPVWPPPPARPDERPWRLKFSGYEHDDILTQTVKTDAEGLGELGFTPEREGYYRVAWTSPQEGGPPIKAETAVWVADNASTEIGYRHGGLQIIVDRDTFRVGQKAPVMLCAPTSDRYVLFSEETDELLSYRLVHLSGSVKLIELPIEEKHVPNVFLSGVMVSDHQAFLDTQEVVVPPLKNFINLSVAADRAEYEPRQEGTFTVTATDHEGRPVEAEIALGLADESVYYIQEDLAGDIRQFFYGDKRWHRIQTQSTFNHKAYLRPPQAAGPAAREEDTGYVVSGVMMARGRYARDVGFVGDVTSLETLEMASPACKAAAPMAPSAPMEPRFAEMAVGGRGGEGEEEPAVVVRTDFRATAFWQPDLVTDGDGRAQVTVKFPDSLTSWKATARAASKGNQFGITNITVITKQPLIVRLQAPRFFVVGDTATVSAVINNNTARALKVRPAIDVDGLVVAGGPTGALDVPAGGEARADWTVVAARPGEARIRVSGTSDKLADAMEKTYVVHEHGIEKFLSKSGKARDGDVRFTLHIPKERRPESATMIVQVAPSLAVTMLDALPYLADYPYGCTEQTMSRFLPAVITAKTLKDLGLSPEAVAGKIFGGIEQEYVSKTHPEGRKELGKLDAMIKAGLERLYDFQHSDGGWGWWKEGDSDHFMTAYVVWGLSLARQAGVDVRPNALERGVAFLNEEIVEEEANYDLQAWMLHALAVEHAAAGRGRPHEFQARALDNLWNHRDRLNAYTRALLALAAHHYGFKDKAETLIRNLENGVKLDTAAGGSVLASAAGNELAQATAHWGEDGLWWRWSDGGVEATAFALRALLAVDPTNRLVEPVVNWLIKNRRGAQWSNTRDTAIVVLTLNEYLRASGELKPQGEYEVQVNGQKVASGRVTPETALSSPSRFAVDRALLRDGENEVRIVRRAGDMPIYYAAEVRFFTLEEPVQPAGNEIFVKRQYFKLVGRPTLLKGYVYDRQPLEDGGEVVSGERVETVITIEAKNNYEYLVFEDLKPAGLESVEVRSGEPLYARELKAGAVKRRFGSEEAAPPLSADAVADDADYTGRSRWVYRELRDRKVVLFIDHLPQGVWEVRYDMRAEVPGRFHALPVLGYAMYVPEIRCNGAEVRLSVQDRP